MPGPAALSRTTEPFGILHLTHSSRRTNLARCSADFLRRRFADPDRLRRLPPFESLPPAAALYSGALSAHRVERGADGRFRLRPLGSVRHRDKIQHAVLTGERELLVGFEHRIERWRLATPLAPESPLAPRGVAVEAVYEHPHLAGLHTVEPLPDGQVAVSSAAADAALVLDLSGAPGGGGRSAPPVRTLRLPADLYGAGYELRPERVLREHYPDDEQQATHLNAASPDRAGGRLAVSSLIPGAVGLFDLASGAYRELVRGHVGCHGARFDDAGAVYFTDSPAGELVVLAPAGDGPSTSHTIGGPPAGTSGSSAAPIARRFATGSRWLHDAVQVAGPVFAFALADVNELHLVDVDSGELLARDRFLTWPVEGLFPLARRWPGWLGNSTQALSFKPDRL